jgi:hypothetical protein
MSVKLQVSQAIDRPVAKVFHWYAHEHVRNHPRWDPDLELEQVSDGPIEVGTLIRRRNIRYGTPVEEIMEVVEFEPNRAFGAVIHGSVPAHGRVTFEAAGDDRTILTIGAEMPSLDESMDTSFLKSRVERSAQNIKDLVEAEVEK